jgi:hypothetical protein
MDVEVTQALQLKQPPAVLTVGVVGQQGSWHGNVVVSITVQGCLTVQVAGLRVPQKAMRMLSVSDRPNLRMSGRDETVESRREDKASLPLLDWDVGRR